jgi:PAS domain S-box-containing protein
LDDRFYRHLFNMSPVALLLHFVSPRDTAEPFTEANESACRLLEYSREELLAVGFRAIVAEKDRAKLPVNWAILLEEGAVDFETELSPKTGGSFPAALSTRLVTLNNRRGGLTAVHDISRREKTLHTLKESENRFRQVVENIREGLFIREFPEDRISYLSPPMEQVYGFSASVFKENERAVIQAIHPEDRPRVERSMADLRNEGVPFHEEYRIKDPTNRWRWIQVKAYPLFDENGRLYRAVGINEDITEQVEAAFRLKESERKYRSLFEESPVALFEQDYSAAKRRIDEIRKGSGDDLRSFLHTRPDLLRRLAEDIRITDMNRAALSLYKARTKAEFISGLPRLFNKETYHTFLETIIAIAEEKPSFTIETINRTFAGEDIHIQLRWAAAPGCEKTYENVRVTIVDITDRIRAEKRLKESEEKYRQARKMEALGTLTGGIAHQFNNILSIIVGNADLIQADIPEWHPAARNLNDIQTAGRRARDMVRQLIDFSRAEEMTAKPLDPAAILRETERLIRPDFPQNIQLMIQAPPIEEAVSGDAAQLHQLLKHLIDNARWSMQETGGKLTISLQKTTLTPETAADFPELKPGRYVHLTVSDTGCGIPENMRERIFDPFFTTKEVGEGMGMGLAAVHGIVRRHEGAVRVQSRVGVGSVFDVYLPAAEAPPVQESADAAPPQESAHILFVDDEAAVVRMVRTMLQRMGYAVTAFRDAEAALARFKNAPHRFDLVITDVEMRPLPGDALAATVREIRPEIPVIYCTGYSDLLRETAPEEHPKDPVLLKPIHMRDLETAVKRALSPEKENAP